MKRILILSDGRVGHLNQSIAFAKYMSLPYDIVLVNFHNKMLKILSYFYDSIGIYSSNIFTLSSYKEEYSIVVGAGSSTYYAVKVLAKKMLAKSITMMLPKGYRYNFDIIFSQKHDMPPNQENIKIIPANFSYIEPKNIFISSSPSIGIIIGGDNGVFTFELECLKKQLDYIVKNYANKYTIAITSSPRTCVNIEALIKSYGFDYEVIFSQNPVNPIPDFLKQCEIVFITMDSTSMVSEAISYGEAHIVILPLKIKKENKYTRFINTLKEEGYLHLFDGSIEKKNKKIFFSQYIKSLML